MLKLSQLWLAGNYSRWLHYLRDMSSAVLKPFFAFWPNTFQTHLVLVPCLCSGPGHFSRFLPVDSDLLNQGLGSRCWGLTAPGQSHWTELGDLEKPFWCPDSDTWTPSVPTSPLGPGVPCQLAAHHTLLPLSFTFLIGSALPCVDVSPPTYGSDAPSQAAALMDTLPRPPPAWAPSSCPRLGCSPRMGCSRGLPCKSMLLSTRVFHALPRQSYWLRISCRV